MLLSSIGFNQPPHGEGELFAVSLKIHAIKKAASVFRLRLSGRRDRPEAACVVAFGLWPKRIEPQARRYN
jgi:hypothetical protein